jgi:hypothetical protein
VESMSKFCISIFNAASESEYVNICTRRPRAYNSLAMKRSHQAHAWSTNTWLNGPSYYHTPPYLNNIYDLFSNRLLRSTSNCSARCFLFRCASVPFCGP